MSLTKTRDTVRVPLLGPGLLDYQLDATFYVEDANGKVQVEVTGGNGTIDVQDGDEFYVDTTGRAGGYEVVLRATKPS